MCFFRHFVIEFEHRALKHQLKCVILEIEQYSTERLHFRMDIEQVSTEFLTTCATFSNANIHVNLQITRSLQIFIESKLRSTSFEYYFKLKC
jgi:hypothetical protein